MLLKHMLGGGVMSMAINDLKRGLVHKELQLAKEALEAEFQYIK